jgi:malonyl-CoA/methylmalonyl-CoA synthetase
MADGSLPGRWLARWRERPAFEQLRAPDGRWLRSDELEARTRIKAGQLRAAGLRQNDRFVISAPTSVELVVAYIAALRAGLTVMPLNPAYTRSEVERIVQDARPVAAAVDDAERGRWIVDATSADQGGTPTRSAPVQIFGIELDLQVPPDDREIDTAETGDPALLVYTSGTTGRPKGVPLTHGNLLASATAVNLAWRWQQDDQLLLALPLFHVHGLGVGLNGSLCAGAAFSLRTKFDVDDVVEQSARGTTMFFGVPAMYQRLASAGPAALNALRALRLLVSGSAPLPAALAQEIAVHAGQTPLERYGMTETIMLTSNPYAGERRPGTVGFPLPGVEVRLAPGAGEIEVRGPNVISGYYQNPEANREAFTADRWFRTGDLGEYDEAGYLRIIGRSKELIITGGFNVYPREVEEVLMTHPGVIEVAVVGRASERWGEEVTAVVVPRGQVDPEDLLALAASQLVTYKVPKRVEFIDELPRNALGKLVRHEL